jgi:hypothetical protein
MWQEAAIQIGKLAMLFWRCYLPSTTDGVAHVCMPRQKNRVEPNHHTLPGRIGFCDLSLMGMGSPGFLFVAIMERPERVSRPCFHRSGGLGWL